jgi:hypothetical protein
VARHARILRASTGAIATLAALAAACRPFATTNDPALVPGGDAATEGGGPDGALADAGAPDRGAPVATGKIVFVTKATYPASFADAATVSGLCAAEARGILAPTAWTGFLLFDSGFPDIGPGPWRLPSGARVAESTKSLVGGQLAAPIDQAPDGTRVTGSAWTGSNSDGTKSGNCDDWTNQDSQIFAVMGSTAATDTKWLDDLTPIACNESRRLFCFER